MVTSEELNTAPIFAALPPEARQEFAAKAADIRLRSGEYLLHEGDPPHFYVLLEGSIGMFKELHGRQQLLDRKEAVSYFGELPLSLLSPFLVSIQAEQRCRLARFELQQFQELHHRYPSFSDDIFASIAARMQAVKGYVKAMPSTRIHLYGEYQDVCGQSVRSFLRANRLQYEWHPTASAPAMEIDGVALAPPFTLRTLADGLGMQTAPKLKEYDLVIVGAGPAGMAAAVYGASEGLSTLLIERSAVGGQAGTSSRIENYLGFPSGVSGAELSGRALRQARRFDAEIVVVRKVTGIAKNSECFDVVLDDEEVVKSRTVLLATGVEWRLLDSPGIDDLTGRGVFYGASRTEALSLCGKRVFLVGGGNSAGQAAMFLSSYAAEVHLLVRGKGLAASMSRYLMDQLASRENIYIHTRTTVEQVHGSGQLEAVTTRTHTGDDPNSIFTHDADALFIMIGADARTEWLPPVIERDERGFLCTGQHITSWPLDRAPFPLETSLPGLFCAGDLRAKSVKRVASSVGDGSMAVSMIHEYLAL
jgi:thioredoxin reductase (NADPH)